MRRTRWLLVIAALGCSGGDSGSPLDAPGPSADAACVALPGFVHDVEDACLRATNEIVCAEGELMLSGLGCWVEDASDMLLVSSWWFGHPIPGFHICTDAESETAYAGGLCEGTEVGVMECAPVDGACPAPCHAISGTVMDPAFACTRPAPQLACSLAQGGSEGACAVEIATGRIAYTGTEVLLAPYFVGWRRCTEEDLAAFGAAPACP